MMKIFILIAVAVVTGNSEHYLKTVDTGNIFYSLGSQIVSMVRHNVFREFFRLLGLITAAIMLLFQCRKLTKSFVQNILNKLQPQTAIQLFHLRKRYSHSSITK